MSYYERLSDQEKLKKVNGMIERAKIEKAKLNNKERKKRANELIQKGALLEKYFDMYDLSVEETEEVLKVFAEYVKANKPNKYKKEE